MSLLRDLLNGTPLTTSAVAEVVTAAAAAAPIETATRAAAQVNNAVLITTGNPAQDLANILSAFEAHAGQAPRVNPPEAAKVLATKTAPEVAGVPEPEEEELVVDPPTSKPASVVAAEAVPRSRRTAAVVQQELDALIEVHNKLSAAYEALKGEGRVSADSVREEFKAEVQLIVADLEKATARADELQKTSDSQQEMLVKAAQAITALNAGARAPVAAAAAALEDASSLALANALQAQGWIVQLTVAP